MSICYKHKINKIIYKLAEIYDKAPPSVLEEYEYLFSYFESNEPMRFDGFGYWPKYGTVRSPYGIIILTKTHNKIFNILAKNIVEMGYVPKRYIYNAIFGSRETPLPFSSFEMHIHNLNKRLNEIMIKLTVKRNQGVSVEYYGESDNPFDWQPY